MTISNHVRNWYSGPEPEKNIDQAIGDYAKEKKISRPRAIQLFAAEVLRLGSLNQADFSKLAELEKRVYAISPDTAEKIYNKSISLLLPDIDPYYIQEMATNLGVLSKYPGFNTFFRLLMDMLNWMRGVEFHDDAHARRQNLVIQYLNLVPEKDRSDQKLVEACFKLAGAPDAVEIYSHISKLKNPDLIKLGNYVLSLKEGAFKENIALMMAVHLLPDPTYEANITNFKNLFLDVKDPENQEKILRVFENIHQTSRITLYDSMRFHLEKADEKGKVLLFQAVDLLPPVPLPEAAPKGRARRAYPTILGIEAEGTETTVFAPALKKKGKKPIAARPRPIQERRVEGEAARVVFAFAGMQDNETKEAIIRDLAAVPQEMRTAGFIVEYAEMLSQAPGERKSTFAGILAARVRAGESPEVAFILARLRDDTIRNEVKEVLTLLTEEEQSIGLIAQISSILSAIPNPADRRNILEAIRNCPAEFRASLIAIGSQGINEETPHADKAAILKTIATIQATIQDPALLHHIPEMLTGLSLKEMQQVSVFLKRVPSQALRVTLQRIEQGLKSGLKSGEKVSLIQGLCILSDKTVISENIPQLVMILKDRPAAEREQFLNALEEVENKDVQDFLKAAFSVMEAIKERMVYATVFNLDAVKALMLVPEGERTPVLLSKVTNLFGDIKDAHLRSRVLEKIALFKEEDRVDGIRAMIWVHSSNRLSEVLDQIIAGTTPQAIYEASKLWTLRQFESQTADAIAEHSYAFADAKKRAMFISNAVDTHTALHYEAFEDKQAMIGAVRLHPDKSKIGTYQTTINNTLKVLKPAVDAEIARHPETRFLPGRTYQERLHKILEFVEKILTKEPRSVEDIRKISMLYSQLDNDTGRNFVIDVLKLLPPGIEDIGTIGKLLAFMYNPDLSEEENGRVLSEFKKFIEFVPQQSRSPEFLRDMIDLFEAGNAFEQLVQIVEMDIQATNRAIFLKNLSEIHSDPRFSKVDQNLRLQILLSMPDFLFNETLDEDLVNDIIGMGLVLQNVSPELREKLIDIFAMLPAKERNFDNLITLQKALESIDSRTAQKQIVAILRNLSPAQRNMENFNSVIALLTNVYISVPDEWRANQKALFFADIISILESLPRQDRTLENMMTIASIYTNIKNPEEEARSTIVKTIKDIEPEADRIRFIQNLVESFNKNAAFEDKANTALIESLKRGLGIIGKGTNDQQGILIQLPNMLRGLKMSEKLDIVRRLNNISFDNRELAVMNLIANRNKLHTYGEIIEHMNTANIFRIETPPSTPTDTSSERSSRSSSLRSDTSSPPSADSTDDDDH